MQLLVLLLSHVALPHGLYSPLLCLHPAEARPSYKPPLVLTPVLLALQNSLIYHGERFWREAARPKTSSADNYTCTRAHVEGGEEEPGERGARCGRPRLTQ